MEFLDELFPVGVLILLLLKLLKIRVNRSRLIVKYKTYEDNRANDTRVVPGEPNIIRNHGKQKARLGDEIERSELPAINEEEYRH